MHDFLSLALLVNGEKEMRFLLFFFPIKRNYFSFFFSVILGFVVVARNRRQCRHRHYCRYRSFIRSFHFSLAQNKQKRRKKKMLSMNNEIYLAGIEWEQRRNAFTRRKMIEDEIALGKCLNIHHFYTLRPPFAATALFHSYIMNKLIFLSTTADAFWISCIFFFSSIFAFVYFYFYFGFYLKVRHIWRETIMTWCWSFILITGRYSFAARHFFKNNRWKLFSILFFAAPCLTLSFVIPFIEILI